MNATIVIASRELRDRSRLFLIAACMAVVPFFAALTVSENRSLAIATVTGFLAAAYTCSLALALGVSMIGRELTEKRLSFLFAKPVSVVSIWFGKVAAGLLTWLVAFGIVVLPTLVFANSGWKDMWVAGGDHIAAYTLVMSTILFFGGHAVSTMLRSRSALVALDFVLLVMTVIVALAVVRPILLGGGTDVVVRLLPVMAVALLVILTIAPVWQLVRGRIDPRRNHVALSTVLWSGTAIVLVVAAGYALWVISPPLSSMTDFNSVQQSPSGRWISVSSNTLGRGSYIASFLIDSASGERERVAVPPWGEAHFSSDGGTMVWMENDELLPRNGIFRLYTRRLEAGAKQLATPLVMAMPRHAQLSEDGSRIAITKGNRLEVYELASGRLLGAAAGINAGEVRLLFFSGPDVVRVVETSRGANAETRFRQLDLSRRKLTTSAGGPAPVAPFFNVTRDGSRIYIAHDATILDARTGAVLVTLPVKPTKPYFGAMLRDGSTIITRDSKLFHFDPDGVLAGEVALPVPNARVAGQVGTSKVLLSVGGNNPDDWRMLLVDLAARKVSVVMSGVRSPLAWWLNPVVPQFTEDATIVAMDGWRKLVLWDVRTGAKRPFPS